MEDSKIEKTIVEAMKENPVSKLIEEKEELRRRNITIDCIRWGIENLLEEGKDVGEYSIDELIEELAKEFKMKIKEQSTQEKYQVAINYIENMKDIKQILEDIKMEEGIKSLAQTEEEAKIAIEKQKKQRER